MRYPLVLTEPERPLRQPRVKDKGPGSVQLDIEAPLLSPPSLSTAHLHLASAQPGGQSPPGVQSLPGGQTPPGAESLQVDIHLQVDSPLQGDSPLLQEDTSRRTVPSRWTVPSGGTVPSRRADTSSTHQGPGGGFPMDHRASHQGLI